MVSVDGTDMTQALSARRLAAAGPRTTTAPL
jgi:hypothetical protein